MFVPNPSVVPKSNPVVPSKKVVVPMGELFGVLLPPFDSFEGETDLLRLPAERFPFPYCPLLLPGVIARSPSYIPKRTSSSDSPSSVRSFSFLRVTAGPNVEGVVEDDGGCVLAGVRNDFVPDVFVNVRVFTCSICFSFSGIVFCSSCACSTCFVRLLFSALS